ncbi:MAG: flavodoxin family protein [Deltaproteobacteria bacterium]|nr:flavodoxin family protein [Deltaproteobacteria bacterium]
MAFEITENLFKPKVLAVGASPRKGGNSDVLLGHFLAGVKRASAGAVEIQLRDCQITPCIGCELCRQSGQCTRFNDDMVGIYKNIIEFRGLFLISPVHNYNITAWMKGFIDRLYCFYDFVEPRPGKWSSKLANQGRKAVIAAVAEQSNKEEMGVTLEAMEKPLEALGYTIIQKFPVLGIFEKGKVADYPEIIRSAELYGEKLAREIIS